MRVTEVTPQALEPVLVLEGLAAFPALTLHFPSFTIVHWLWKLNMKERGGGGKNFYGDAVQKHSKFCLFEQPENLAF